MTWIPLVSMAALAKAAEKGLPAKNCQYCHVSSVPTKDKFKPEDLNERGQWLLAEKERQKAKNVDVEWLKSYVGSKDRK